VHSANAVKSVNLVRVLSFCRVAQTTAKAQINASSFRLLCAVNLEIEFVAIKIQLLFQNLVSKFSSGQNPQAAHGARASR